MSRTAGIRPIQSEERQDERSYRSASSTHFKNHPAPESKGSERSEPRIDQLLSSYSSETMGLSQLRLVLSEREREVAGLRARIADLEASIAANRDQTLPSPMPENCVLASREREVEPIESRHPNPVDLDLPLRRVAVTYSSDSVPPAVVPPMMRQSERQRCELQIEFTEETQLFAGLTQDISEGGVFIATYHLRPVGMRLDLSFVLPDGVEIQTGGIVRWLRDGATEGLRPGMGVAFTDLRPECLESLNRYCRKRAPLYMDV